MNGGSGGRQENKIWSLIHGPRFLTILLMISMIHVEASQNKMSTLDQGLNKIRSPSSVKTAGKTKTQSSRICNTTECADVANQIRRFMNPSVDPCDNFYKFVCGRYREQNPLNGKWVTNTYRKRGWWFRRYLKEKLIKGLAKLNGVSDEVMQIPSDIYKSCMNLKAIDKEGDAPLKQLIREFGGWSLVEENGQWDENNWDFAKALLAIHRNYISKGPLFEVKASYDAAADSSRFVFEIDEAPFKGSYSPPKVDAYRGLIRHIAFFLGGRTNLDGKVQELVDFEAKLAKLGLPPRDIIQTTFNRMTAADLQREMPTFNWYNHLQGMFAPKHLPKTETFEVSRLPYLKGAMELVNNTSKSVLSNYLVWYVIKDEIPYMSSFYRRQYEQYQRNTWNERWAKCIDDINTYFTRDIIGAGFLADNFTNNLNIIKPIEVMVNEIRDAFKENVNSLTWVDDHTKRAIMDKVNGMKSEVGFPKYLLDPVEVSKKFKRYKNLNIRNDTLLSNKITIMKVKQKDMLAKFQKPMDKGEWNLIYAQSVSGESNPYTNMLSLGLLLISPPFYYPVDEARALNFGAIGSTIGHEIAHGYGVRCWKFNKDGKVKGQLWTNQAINRFHDRLPCFEKQYSQYYVSGYQVNGTKTLDENLSDVNGLKAALKAYHNWAKLNPSEKWLLPGLNFTNEQLFYVGFGQSYCTNFIPNYARYMFQNHIYPTHDIRVIGTLVNSCEFANAFKCKKNSPMNPLEKCALWNQKGSLF